MISVAQFQTKDCYKGTVASRPDHDLDPKGLEEHGGWPPNSGSMPGYIEDSAVVAMIVPNLLSL